MCHLGIHIPSCALANLSFDIYLWIERYVSRLWKETVNSENKIHTRTVSNLLTPRTQFESHTITGRNFLAWVTSLLRHPFLSLSLSQDCMENGNPGEHSIQSEQNILRFSLTPRHTPRLEKQPSLKKKVGNSSFNKNTHSLSSIPYHVKTSNTTS